MSVQTFALPHLPPHLVVHVALYRDVENASTLRQALLAGRPEYEYALIDGKGILSVRHVLAAAHRALHDHLQGRRRATNVHAEMVYALSPTKNITEAFRRFGIQDDTRCLVVLKAALEPSTTRESVQEHLDTIIVGTAVDVSDQHLAGWTDLARVRQCYGLGGNGGPETGRGSRGRGGGRRAGPAHPRTMTATMDVDRDDARERQELQLVVLGLMALREAS
ncbi:MAG: hypothetical protein M1823_004795 [Watsoniomyces obsoletus]|nr:MAG: hypothetical protein M1823_004795 [Watsoniomyces obsoletus]